MCHVTAACRVAASSSCCNIDLLSHACMHACTIPTSGRVLGRSIYRYYLVTVNSTNRSSVQSSRQIPALVSPECPLGIRHYSNGKRIHSNINVSTIPSGSSLRHGHRERSIAFGWMGYSGRLLSLHTPARHGSTWSISTDQRSYSCV